MSKLLSLARVFTLSVFALGACLAEEQLSEEELSSEGQLTEAPPLSCVDTTHELHTEVVCLKPNGQMGEKDCYGDCTFDRAWVGTPTGLQCRQIALICETPDCELACGNPD